MEEARLEGKEYFYVSGLAILDKRYGHYEIETGKLYTLDKIKGHKIRRVGREPYSFLDFEQVYVYYKNYYHGRNKNNIGDIEQIEISKEEYEKLGGDLVRSCYTQKGVGGYYQRDYY